MLVPAIDVRLRLAIIIGAFVVLMSMLSSAYWLGYVKPKIDDDIKTLSSSMAAVQANNLAQVLSQKGVSNSVLLIQLETLLTLVHEYDNRPFIYHIDLTLDEAFSQAKQLQTQFKVGDSCRDCYYREYPIYSPRNFALIGVVTFALPQQRIDEHISSVQQLFLVGLLMIVLAVVVIVGLISQMADTLSKVNQQLEEKVAERTEALRAEMSEHEITQEKLSAARDETQRLERSRIAKTLHDGIGQVLQALKLGLHALNMQVDKDSQQHVDELIDETGDAINIIREFCSELRPLHLERMSLAEALINHLARLDKRIPRMKLAIDDNSEPSLLKKLSLLEKEQLFLVTTELVNNAIKHSQASELMVELNSIGHLLILTIRDNGVGFDPDNQMNSEGLGLFLVEERIQRIGASIKIHSSPLQGVRAACQFEVAYD